MVKSVQNRKAKKEFIKFARGTFLSKYCLSGVTFVCMVLYIFITLIKMAIDKRQIAYQQIQMVKICHLDRSPTSEYLSFKMFKDNNEDQ